MFIFVCLSLLLLLLSRFSLFTISGQNSIFCSKDAAATIAAVGLIKRTIMMLLWTLRIVYYSRELSVQ